MNEIDNHNCCGLCVEQYCSNLESHFEIVKINNLEILIALCGKHMEKWMVAKQK